MKGSSNREVMHNRTPSQALKANLTNEPTPSSTSLEIESPHIMGIRDNTLRKTDSNSKKNRIGIMTTENSIIGLCMKNCNPENIT